MRKIRDTIRFYIYLAKWFVYYGLLSRNSENLVKQITFLKAALKKIPCWAEGHLQLAVAQVNLFNVNPDRINPRSLAMLRSSINASELLSGDKGKSDKEHLANVNFARASLLFFNKNYQACVESMIEFVKEGQVNLLESPSRVIALENGAASAIALGNEQLAYQFVKDIPDELISSLNKQLKMRYSR